MTVAICDLITYLGTWGVITCAMWAIVIAITDESEEKEEE